ncbi:hypothetical protein [Brevundimonas sp.]|uniref:hypothetical protein n=1 Tax=Brevundimonas sp. TaxID=1871086 RepID=UPI002ABCA13A|nr:hypothetical protein [Brevundimonas sp.]MDZ4364148.1 hypothetical protein [Brevundimonas sp.]
MLNSLLGTICRFRILGMLVLAMAFAMPAFQSHACAGPRLDAAVSEAVVVSAASADDCSGCPDCGPACASGCCHAPHSAMAADLTLARTIVTFERPSVWTHMVRAPMTRPSGPERPPRI